MVTSGSIHTIMRLREVEADCLSICLPGSRQRAYKAVIQVEPLRHFSLMPEEEQHRVLAAFRGLLARLPIGEEISIHARIRPYDVTPYLEQVRAARERTASLAIQELAHDHEQFVQGLVEERALLTYEFFVRLTASHPTPTKRRGRQASVMAWEQAKSDLERKTQAVLEDLQRCGLVARRLTSEGLIEYYRSCLHLHQAEKEPLAPANVAAVGTPLRSHRSDQKSASPTRALVIYEETGAADDAPHQEEVQSDLMEAGISDYGATSLRRWTWWRGKALARQQQKLDRQATPEPTPHLISLPELIQPSLVEQHRHYLCVHQETSEYSRARAVIGYTRTLVSGWFDRLLSLDEPNVDIVLSLTKLDPTVLTRRLTTKMTKLRGAQLAEWRAGRTENPYTQASRDDIEPLRDALVRQEEHLHSVSFYICSRAASLQELRVRDQKVAAVLQSLELVNAELTYEHLHAWRCILPDGIDVLKRHRLLDTSSLVTAFPFTVCNLSTPEPGLLVGTTAARGPVLIHPSSTTLENGHELIIARSGAGKSFHLKLSLLRALLAGIPAMVIDPEDEYTELCQFVGGSLIRLAPGDFPLNPFDLVSLPGERKRLEEHVERLLVLFDLLLAEKTAGVLSRREKGYLSKRLFQVYADRGITDDPTTHHLSPPSMADVAVLIEAEGDPYQLGERLRRYVSLFPEHTTVRLDSSLVVFSIRDLPADLQPVGLYLVIEHVWNAIRKETTPPARFLMIDEAWTLMQFPEGAEFLSSLSRRARKYHLHLKVCTQQAEDFLASKAGRVLVQNSAMKLLMLQDTSTVDAVAKAFDLSPEERAYLPTCRPGEGLFILRSSRTPLFAAASPLEYRLASTNPQERWLVAEIAAVQANETVVSDREPTSPEETSDADEDWPNDTDEQDGLPWQSLL